MYFCFVLKLVAANVPTPATYMKYLPLIIPTSWLTYLPSSIAFRAFFMFFDIFRFLAISLTVPVGIYPSTGLFSHSAIPHVISLNVPSPPAKIIAS